MCRQGCPWAIGWAQLVAGVGVVVFALTSCGAAPAINGSSSGATGAALATPLVPAGYQPRGDLTHPLSADVLTAPTRDRLSHDGFQAGERFAWDNPAGDTLEIQAWAFSTASGAADYFATTETNTTSRASSVTFASPNGTVIAEVDPTPPAPGTACGTGGASCPKRGQVSLEVGPVVYNVTVVAAPGHDGLALAKSAAATLAGS